MAKKSWSFVYILAKQYNLTDLFCKISMQNLLGHPVRFYAYDAQLLSLSTNEWERETKHDICLSCKLPNEAYFTVVKLVKLLENGSTNLEVSATQIRDNLFLTTTFVCLRETQNKIFDSI